MPGYSCCWRCVARYGGCSFAVPRALISLSGLPCGIRRWWCSERMLACRMPVPAALLLGAVPWQHGFQIARTGVSSAGAGQALVLH